MSSGGPGRRGRGLTTAGPVPAARSAARVRDRGDRSHDPRAVACARRDSPSHEDVDARSALSFPDGCLIAGASVYVTGMAAPWLKPGGSRAVDSTEVAAVNQPDRMFLAGHHQTLTVQFSETAQAHRGTTGERA